MARLSLTLLGGFHAFSAMTGRRPYRSRSAGAPGLPPARPICQS